MTVVIRPASAVFQKTMPLMVVFGAYRSPDQADAETDMSGAMANIIAQARRYRVPLAYCRRVNVDGSSPNGHWLVGTAPRIKDMVFDHREASCFSNPEMLGAIRLRARVGLCFVGLPGDSDFQHSIQTARHHNLAVSVVDLSDMMQKCSTTQTIVESKDYFPSTDESVSVIPYSKWIRDLRFIDSHE